MRCTNCHAPISGQPYAATMCVRCDARCALCHNCAEKIPAKAREHCVQIVMAERHGCTGKKPPRAFAIERDVDGMPVRMVGGGS